MVNLSQPISFQTAAMAAFDVVESRAMSRANSGQPSSSNGERQEQGGSTGAFSSRKKAPEKMVDQANDDFELDDEGAPALGTSTETCLIELQTTTPWMTSALCHQRMTPHLR